MSQVVKNNRGFLQLVAVCPAHQRQLLLRTASPQQLHALVQVLYNILKGAMSPNTHARANENKLEKDGPTFSSCVGDFGRLFLSV